MGKCKYCNGNCPNDPDYMCDGYAGDIDNLYENEGANRDDQRAVVLESCRLVTTCYDFSRTF